MLVKTLFVIDGEPVILYDDGWIRFRSNLDIDNDGSGPAHGDTDEEPDTSLHFNGLPLNADIDKYFVVPPQIILAVPEIVLGCQGRLTRLSTKVSSPAVVGDVGPHKKLGEAAYILAKTVNPNVGHNSGDERHDYLYELKPGSPAVVDGKTYNLQAYRPKK
jgi:hypothetical protein